MSSANFDLSTGTTDAGAINVVTRTRGNDLHGAAFYFLRDHTLAAYPALARDPANHDPNAASLAWQPADLSAGPHLLFFELGAQ